MARRPTASPAPQHAQLTPEKMRIGIRRLEQCIAEVEAFNPATSPANEIVAKTMAVKAMVESALAQTFGSATVEYQCYADATLFDSGFYFSLGEIPHNIIVDSLKEKRANALALLREAVSFLQRELKLHAEHPSLDELVQPVSLPTAATHSARKIFVVHGHDEAALQSVARFLEQLGLDAIILREQPDSGRTIIEKFVDCAAEVGFAVVLLTPDDLGGPAAAATQATRARQSR
jgi:hypothetical protein